jgi:hypothetical protein
MSRPSDISSATFGGRRCCLKLNPLREQRKFDEKRGFST